MIRNLLAAAVLLITFNATSQESMWEALEHHGESAVYVQYSAQLQDDGTLIPGDQQGRYTISLERLPDQTPVGIKITEVETGKGLAAFTVVQRNFFYDHFPLTTYIREPQYGNAYAAVGDYIFSINRVYDTRKLYAMSSIYVLENTTEKDMEEKDTKKKKGGFFKKLKEKAESLGAPKMDKYQKMISTLPPNFLQDYIDSMKKRQESYTITAYDKARLTSTKMAREAKVKGVQKRNSDIINTPEYQAALAKQRGDIAHSKSQKVTIKNNSSNQIVIITSSSTPSYLKISGRSSGQWDCGTDGYIGSGADDGATSGFTKGKKVYSANSSCGGTVTIN